MATFLAWSEAFSVGVAQFDEEHKQLIALINELHDSARAGTTGESLGRIFDALIEHAAVHFAHEECFFAEVGFPRAALHKAMHEHLTKRLLGFRSEVGRKDSALLAEELLQFLGVALAHHIQGEDKKYGAYLNSKGIG